MPAFASSSISLPQGVSSEEALEIARSFAPLLFLHRSESHLPDDPDDFKKLARFRESNHRGFIDRGFHKQNGWEETDEHGPEYHGISWKIIHQESHSLFSPYTLNPPDGRNLRPRDRNNILAWDSAKGIFLERAEHLSRRESGLPPGENNLIQAPIFVDTAYNPSTNLVRVLYWFFYSLNWWQFLITHEGDWEHITLVFWEEDFKSGNPPDVVYLAQHNGGVPISYSKIKKEGSDIGRHPVIYVDRNGHPCNPDAKNPERYTLRWETWNCLRSLVPNCPWCDFAGAWGEVGEMDFMTGPLGPLFKRHKDDVRTGFKNGRYYVKVPKTWR